MTYPRHVPGDRFGLDFPTSIDNLLEQGAEFLTAAFRACAALDADNRVVGIDDAQEFVAGGMGRKLLLRVRYARPQPDLHSELFVKFPRDFGDPLRELFSPLMRAEIDFALLSRQPGFPVEVPRCYFADFHADSASGLLITERIGFGQGGIEPPHDKCQDYELDDPLAHYQALTLALARIAGAHKAGQLGPGLDSHYPPPNPEFTKDRIPYSPTELADKLEKLHNFVERVPQLFPPHLRSRAFLDAFAREAPLFLEHEQRIRRFLASREDYIALCHWNANVDNAWFQRDAAGQLQAGLLDWGSVGQMNLAQAMFGMLCAAETEFLDAHRRDLLHLFVEEYRHSGGPRIEVETLELCLDLAIALLGIAWMLDAPSLIEAQLTDVETLADRHDPRLRSDFLARAQLHLLSVFLHEWQARKIGALIPRLAGLPIGAIGGYTPNGTPSGE